jgi:L-asparaginase II
MHTERVANWLTRIGCSPSDLACGPHELRHEPTVAAMRARGEKPTELHNNCSGKHTGFLTLARHLGAPVAHYVDVQHPVQQRVASTLAQLAGIDGALSWGVDGCTAPNFLVSLADLARALAGLADPAKLPRERAAAVRRVIAAMTAHPELVAGTGRVCTRLMTQSGGRLAVKTGAEGVYVAILPELGLAAALKIDDGAARASETAIAALLIGLGALRDDGAAHATAHASVRDTRGNIVGERRAAHALLELRP